MGTANLVNGERSGAPLYSFQGKLVAAFWQSATVRDRTIPGVLKKLRVRLPNVNAIAVKTNTGHVWLGATGSNTPPTELDINTVDDLKRWADTCAAFHLDCIAWCVVRGQFPEQEAERIREVCAVPGIAAMVLDVEVGEAYFRGQPRDAAFLARAIRRGAPDKYIGLCFDARGRLPQGIFVQEWLPYVSGLHPMVYPETFRRDPVLAVRDAFGVIAQYEAYRHLPVTVWVRAHTLGDPDSLLRAAPAIFDHPRAKGLVLWRYGDDVMREREWRAVRQLHIPDHVPAPRPLALYPAHAQIQAETVLRRAARKTRLTRALRRLKLWR